MNQEIHRRSHLTKEQRLPQSYKEVEKILNIVKRCEANVKTALNNSKLRGAVLHKVSGLTFNVLRQSRVLESIMEKTQILEKEPFFRKELAGILIHELIFGNGLPGKSKPVETVLKYQTDIENAYNDLKSDDSLFSSLISIPKYVRVNTLAITLPEVLEDLEYLGVIQIVFDANISEDEFYELVKNLEKNTFLFDYHFKDLLIFHGEENLASWSLYQKGHVFIQDKSSYIPAYVLSPPPGAAVIDACAAPGMKTLHLTALMENNGMVYAFERDQQRFEILNKMLKSGHANICETFCGDFNTIDPTDDKYSSVEYILLDPSCSGSGMVSRMDYITDTKESKNDLRIQKLAGFQIILLKHALLFPSVKKVVYSTCSITETENEFVVHEVLNHFSHRFKLSPVLPDWSIRGSDDFEFGSRCLRAYPDKCLTNGFFVAMFERLEDSEEQYRSEKRQHKREKKKHVSDSKQSRLCQNDSQFNNEKDNCDSDCKSKDQFVGEERKNDTTENVLTEAIEEMPPKKKHKKKHKKDRLASVDKEHTDMQDEKVATLIIGRQNNNSTPTIEEVNPRVKNHKRKHDNEYSSNINSNDYLIETQDANIQDSIFTDATQEINLRQKKNKRKYKHSSSNISLNNTQIEEFQTQNIVNTGVTLEVKPHKKKNKKKQENECCANIFSDTQSSNVEVDSFIEVVPEGKSLHKKKKHRRKLEKEDSNNSFQESQTAEVQIQNSNIEDNILTQIAQEVETPHKTKKKHKRKSEDDDHYNSFCETQTLVSPLYSSNVQNKTSAESALEGERLHKTKKKHRKREKRDCNNSFCETQIPEVQTRNSTENDILTETLQEQSSHKKKKKHKRKHETEN